MILKNQKKKNYQMKKNQKIILIAIPLIKMLLLII